MYYGLLILAVVMFGVQFFFNDAYKKERGSDVTAALTLTFLSGIAGLVCLIIINGFDISATPFTVIMGAVTALNSVLFTFCSLKALEKINLSLFSVFTMLGGMMLPFVQGLIFYDEPMTVAKALCLIFVILALALTVNKGERRGGTVYYIGVFVLNGMSGVLSKLYQELPYEKSSSAVYSVWIAIMSSAMAVLCLLFMIKKMRIPSVKGVLFGMGCGSISRVANYLLLLALVGLPSSVQYPFVTGGTMIVSTVISVITGQKTSQKEILSVALSFTGILLLVFIPI